MLSKHVVDISYKHESDGKLYRHKFDPGLCSAETLPDGSIRLFNPRGVALWGEF